VAEHPRRKSRKAGSPSSKSPRKSRASQPTGKIEDFIGVLAGKTKKIATLEEISRAAEDGWAGKVQVGKK
jgi:hypothetical protein